MSLLLYISASLVVVVWIVSRKVSKPKSLLADVAGPEKEHWLKGRIRY